MKDYYLVLDTETSGLPKKWDVSYDTKNNWPHILQIAWAIYDAKGELLKKENHYIKPTNFKISKASFNIHHLSLDFLKHRGKDLKAVFKRFDNDLTKYQPLVVAHFYELDFHVISATYFRLGLPNLLLTLPSFCTMKASVPYVKNPNFEYLKLNRFYKTLFNKKPTQLHNADADVALTSEIFFYLLNNGEVTDAIIEKQRENRLKSQKESLLKSNRLILLTALLLIIVIVIWFII